MNVIKQAEGPKWVLYNGDSAEVLRALPDHSIHQSTFSPPFSSVYTYSPSDRDLGNVSSREEFFEHFGYVTRELLRVMVPGRVVALHTYDVQLYGTRDGRRARYDFPGDCIRHMEGLGFNFIARITIQKDPQAAAQRNHAQELLFVQLRRDASKCAPAQADYVLIFRAPGENPVPIAQPIDEETWIRWAAPVWTDIRATDILPAAGSKDDDDERHLAPLQLSVYERCYRLWSNPGETVLDPFAGIGSGGVAALRAGRRFVGCELKAAYFDAGCRFLRQEQAQGQLDLFSEVSA